MCPFTLCCLCDTDARSSFVALWRKGGPRDFPQLCSLGPAAPPTLSVQLGQHWGSLCAFLWGRMIPQDKRSFYHGDFKTNLSG